MRNGTGRRLDFGNDRTNRRVVPSLRSATYLKSELDHTPAPEEAKTNQPPAEMRGQRARLNYEERPVPVTEAGLGSVSAPFEGLV